MAKNLIGRARGLICLVAFTAGAVAKAQDVPPPPQDTFEVAFALGYGQGFGSVGSGVPSLRELGGIGTTIALDAGWRIDPSFMIGAYGEFGAFDYGTLSDSSSAKTAAAGIQGQLHLVPGRRYDPWCAIGFGWRGYWASRDAGRHELQGIDLARLRFGVDYRVSSSATAGPVIGVTLTQFLSEKRPGAASWADTTDRKLSMVVFGGVGGRFDL